MWYGKMWKNEIKGFLSKEHKRWKTTTAARRKQKPFIKMKRNRRWHLKGQHLNRFGNSKLKYNDRLNERGKETPHTVLLCIHSAHRPRVEYKSAVTQSSVFEIYITANSGEKSNKAHSIAHSTARSTAEHSLLKVKPSTNWIQVSRTLCCALDFSSLLTGVLYTSYTAR